MFALIYANAVHRVSLGENIYLVAKARCLNMQIGRAGNPRCHDIMLKSRGEQVARGEKLLTRDAGRGLPRVTDDHRLWLARIVTIERVAGRFGDDAMHRLPVAWHDVCIVFCND